MKAEGILTFWGCRGSIPAPGGHTVVFGGNTSCVSVEYEDYVCIFDAGSGIRNLGNYLVERPDIHMIKGSLFLSHTHWDHIQGLPFFKPAFSQENQFTIYGEGKHKFSLSEQVEDQMQEPFFPVDMDTLFQARIKFQEISPAQNVIIGNEIVVMPFRLTHPNAALGYLLHIEDFRLVYVTDHEHDGGKLSSHVLEMVRGSDILIHDAQYSRKDLENGRKGWGHSAWEDVVELGQEAQVGQLFLFHHDPDMTDEQLNKRQYLAQQIFPWTLVAREGLKVPLTTFSVLPQSRVFPRDDECAPLKLAKKKSITQYLEKVHKSA